MRYRARTPQEAGIWVACMIAFFVWAGISNQPDRRDPDHRPAFEAPAVEHTRAPHAAASYDARGGFHPGDLPHAGPADPATNLPLLFALAVGGGIGLLGVFGAWWMWPRERHAPVAAAPAVDPIDAELRALIEAHEREAAQSRRPPSA
jgi:hypothetical protein